MKSVVIFKMQIFEDHLKILVPNRTQYFISYTNIQLYEYYNTNHHTTYIVTRDRFG